MASKGSEWRPGSGRTIGGMIKKSTGASVKIPTAQTKKGKKK